jgi:predicted dehydrogenase
MLKISIIGCGKIADAHASQIQRIADCEIVGVCDREPLMARQLFERFPIGGCYTDVEEMLEKARPDVVHITTPPQGHFELARMCLEHGCHVYVEKPFTVLADEAQELIALAEARGLKLTAGHNDQFSHVARRMREVVASGYLGGVPVHMESCYTYDLQDPAYARALLSDKRHWVRRLPGKLLQNLISHGVARIAEFLPDGPITVVARGFTSQVLKDIGETEIVDELRAVITAESGTTAFFTFSSQMKPSIHEFRVYGQKNGLLLDQDHEILIRLRGAKYKSYADKFIPPVQFAWQNLRAAGENARLFLNRNFHVDSGMKHLIESFYASIRTDGAVPIPYREILLTAQIMEEIFEQLNARPLRETTERPYAAQAAAVEALSR